MFALMTSFAFAGEGREDCRELDVLTPHHIVLARFTAVTAQKGQVEVVLQIVHVYKGSDRLKGETFSAEGSQYEGGLGTVIFNGVPEVGEMSVWAVGGEPGDVSPARGRLGGLSVRSGNLARRFPEIQAWAQAVETVLASERPQDLLKTYAVCSVAEVATWAVRTLDKNWPGEATTKFFRKLLERDNRPPTASVDAQVFADGALGRRLGDAWLDSPRRAEIMRRWAGAGLSDHALRCVFNSLAEAAARREIDAETLLNAIRNALGNTALSDSSKRRFFFLLGKLPEEARRSERVFDFLLSLIESSSSRPIKLDAA
jgi:hypothetical protein